MTLSTILRIWEKAADNYQKESKKLLKRALKTLSENKPNGENLEETTEIVGMWLVLFLYKFLLAIFLESVEAKLDESIRRLDSYVASLDAQADSGGSTDSSDEDKTTDTSTD